tara:strand:- start:290 stop:802 length:513 start_codon:yes stop_codon:yes gene_type:complete
MSDKHNDQKLIMESFRNWSEETPEQLQEEQLDEIQIPGVAWFLRSYQWIEPLLRILADSKRTPESLRGPVKSIADTMTNFKNKMDDFYENYPKLYATVMGPIMAADVAGTATGKVKEKILQDIYKNMDKVEPEGEEAPDSEQPEQEKPASPVITKRDKGARPVIVKKVRE